MTFTGAAARCEVRVTSRVYPRPRRSAGSIRRGRSGRRPTIITDRSGARRTRRWWGIATLLLAMGALLAAGRAAATMVYLSFAYRDQLNPITRPASYYVYVDGGRGPFETSST